MDSNITEVLKGYGFTIENTGGGCDAWCRQFDIVQKPKTEYFNHPYLLVTQDGGADIEAKDMDTCGVTLGYYEFSEDEHQHYFGEIFFHSLDGLTDFLGQIFRSERHLSQPDFPDFDNWQGFYFAAHELVNNGFKVDLNKNDVMPCISYEPANENKDHPQIKVWFNWYNRDLSGQEGKLYAVTQYSPEGEKVVHHEFDNLETTLTVARTMQILAFNRYS